ncbi:MAG: hypothetical protein HW416_1085 [Chloroflexi bacterium]|nr:hypothetical protein [Chloroflexota bacterium]
MARNQAVGPFRCVKKAPETTETTVTTIGSFGLAVALDRSRLTQIGMMVAKTP